MKNNNFIIIILSVIVIIIILIIIHKNYIHNLNLEKFNVVSISSNNNNLISQNQNEVIFSKILLKILKKLFRK
jgi:hypothetical protein